MAIKDWPSAARRRTQPTAALRFAVRNEQELLRSEAANVALKVAEYGRLKDLSLVPVGSHDGHLPVRLQRSHKRRPERGFHTVQNP